MARETIRVRGLKEFQRACLKADKNMRKDVRDRLLKVAEPVKSSAEQLASRNIRNIGAKWSQMRIGATTNVVYVAPKQRSRHTPPQLKRPNLAPLLMNNAMLPALDANAPNVERELEHMLDAMSEDWSHGR